MPTPSTPIAIVGDLFRVTLRGSLFGQTILNTFWYRLANNPTNQTLWTCAIDLAHQINVLDGVEDTMLDCLTADYHLKERRINFVHSGNTGYPYYSELVDTPGTFAGTGSCKNPNVAMSIERRAVGTPTLPRTGIGRVQLAGMDEGQISAGIFSTAYLTAGQAFADTLPIILTGTDGEVFVPCLVSLIPGGFVPHDVFAAFPKETARVMRRRTVGVGV